MKLRTILFCLVLPTISTVSAGEAVFSRTGNVVYAVDSSGKREPVVRKLDLEKQTLQLVSVPGLPGDQRVRNLARSNAGFILCLTDSNIYAWDDEKKGAMAVEVCRAPERGHFVEIAYNPKNSTIALVTRIDSETAGGLPEWNLFALFKGEEKPERVRCRRVRAISGMAFDKKGELHFGTEGDLWHGRIVREPDFASFLQGYRYAPLATRETNMGTSSQKGVQVIAILGEKVYVHVRRMGGSGWGRVVRLDRPASMEKGGGEFEMPFELQERIDVYQAALKTVEDLGENGVYSYLCASPDGKRIYFKANRETKGVHWLVTGDGDPEPIAVSDGD